MKRKITYILTLILFLAATLIPAALDVTPVAAAGQTVQESSWTFSGSWTQENPSNNCDVYCKYTGSNGSYWTYSVNYTKDTIVKIYGLKAPNQGRWDLYIDGSIVVANVDDYHASTAVWKTLLISYMVPAGSHTLKGQNNGTKDGSSSGYFTEFDYLIYDDGIMPDGDLIWTNDNNQIITYTGTWTHLTDQTNYFKTDAHSSATTSDYMEFKFFGPYVGLLTPKGPALGKADIYIDTVLDATIDLYDPASQAQVVVYSNTTLTRAAHTLKVVVRGDKNASSSDVTIIIDAIQSKDGTPKPNTPDDATVGFTCDPTGSNYPSGGSCAVDESGMHIHIEYSGSAADMSEYFFFDPRGTDTDLTYTISGTHREQSASVSNRVDDALRIEEITTGYIYNQASTFYSATGTDVTASASVENMILKTNTAAVDGRIRISTLGVPDYPDTNTWTYIIDVWAYLHIPCSLYWSAMDTEGPYVIDPTVEFPTGLPTDEQEFPVVEGKTYAIHIGGDPWHDGTSTDKYEAAYSWDNVTWQQLRGDGCFYTDPLGQYFYTQFKTVPPGATTLYLRANDTAGQFADNYMDTGEHFTYWITLQSTAMYDSCNYMPLTNAGPYVIDPTIEYPKGSSGTPPDEQMFPVVNGAYYGIRTAGGPWHNGDMPDAERYDAAISWDDKTFTPLADLALCSAANVDDPNNAIFYVQAAGDNLYIRVNDHSEFVGVHYFNDNTVDSEFDYYISLVIYQGAVTCGSQYTYDPETDWLASVNVPATVSYVTAASDLTPGDWYVIEVASGSWKQDGTGADRYDAQFSFGNVMDSGPNGVYQTLQDGQQFVYCTETNGNYVTAYIQADSQYLYLRVNDDALTFSTNTGLLGVNIYHTSFSRKTSTCELQFEIDNLVGHGEVGATQENGVQIGHSITMPGSGSTVSLPIIGDTQLSWLNQPIGDPSPYDVALEPGMWYMLETTGGPWKWLGSTHSEQSYELAINDGSLERWTDLSDWTYPACNIQIDSLGHRRVYFQLPTDSSGYWMLRVADTELWTNNVGSMGYNLYRVYDKKTTMPNGSCDYKYDAAHPVNGPAPIFIGSTLQTGQSLLSTLEQNTIYAIVIRSDEHWTETGGASGTALYTAEISDDDGTTWHDLPDGYGGVMCYIQNGDSTVLFIQTGSHYLYKMRVNSTNFTDNWGGLNVDIYRASMGDTINPFDSCLDGLSKYPIDPHEWIDVHKAEGQLIPISDVYSSDQTVLGFVVEIETGTGPWLKNDGSSPDEHYDAEISHDGGTTWQLIDKYTTDSLITCGGEDHLGRYKWVYFKTAADAVWKIRVNDDTEANFPGHGGNLAYVLYSVTEANVAAPDCVVDTNRADCLPPGVAIAINGQDACTFAVIKPTPPTSLVDVPAWVGYASDWIRFGIDVYLQFMAWCPKHTEHLMAIAGNIKNKEPMATVLEMDQAIEEVKRQVNAYNWNDPNAPRPLVDMSNGFVDAVMKMVFPPMPSSSPWAGGPLVHFTQWTESNYYKGCVANFEDYLGPYLPKSICFVSDWMRETGFSLWFQIVLDLLIVFGIFRDIAGNAVKLTHFMVGEYAGDVKINLKGANFDFDDLADKMARANRDIRRARR